MAKIRVLVVDDSAVVRRMVCSALSEDPRLEVSDAATGRLALARVERDPPDAIVLDLNMPEIDGLEVLRRVRLDHQKLPVIVFSSLAKPAAEATLDALMFGATDYVTKPSSQLGGWDESRQSLLAKIHALFPDKLGAQEDEQGDPVTVRAQAGSGRPPQIVAIASSSGGPVALRQLLATLPASFPVPILVVQHLSANFTRTLAERLDQQCALHVEEARSGVVPQRGQIWIARGDHHLVAVRAGTAGVHLELHQGPKQESCRPAADELFRSLADVYGCHALAVVLTGMGQDGLRGCELLNAAGASILVQDQRSSLVWGMPGAVYKAGLAHACLPLSSIAQEITSRVSADTALLAEAPRDTASGQRS